MTGRTGIVAYAIVASLSLLHLVYTIGYVRGMNYAAEEIRAMKQRPPEERPATIEFCGYRDGAQLWQSPRCAQGAAGPSEVRP